MFVVIICRAEVKKNNNKNRNFRIFKPSSFYFERKLLLSYFADMPAFI